MGVRLHVYDRAVEVAAACEALARRTTRPDLADQLRRASASTVLNIAEGANEFSVKEKARIYRIARRSAAEVDAALHLLGMFGDVDVAAAREANLRVLGLLTRLIASLAPRTRP